MKSFAIWSDHKGESENPEVELHMNYWKLPEDKSSFNKFLDIGFKIKNSSSLENLILYTPFKVAKEEVHDLGKIISQGDASILNAVFNEQYKITTAGNNYNEVKNEKDDAIFNIYILSDDDYEIENRSFDDSFSGNKFDGSILTIKMPPEHVKKEVTYIRIRIQSKNIEDLSTFEKNTGSIINDAFTKAEIFDLRVNSSRHLPVKINQKITDESKVEIDRIHFFYICSYRENYILSHKPFSGARRLEDNVWEKYVSSTLKDKVFDKNETFVAYQWTKNTKPDGVKIKHFNVFMKTDYRYKNWRTIFYYLCFALAFGILTSMLASAAYSAISSFLSEKPKETETTLKQ